ncbi:MAG: YicC/YloC family endoribonuclease [Sodalis sp. (in: enterobacteria)]
MIRSMTAFARHEIKKSWGTASWEIRSVNQRYLEIYIRLPEEFRGLELLIRERIRLHITRGKVECTLHFNVTPNTYSTLILNKKLAKQLLEASQWIKTQSDEGEIDPLAILRWPGVITSAEQDLDIISAELLSELDNTIDDFIIARETEGHELKKLIENRLLSMNAETDKVRQQMPEVLLWQRERVLIKLNEAQVQLDNNRLEQGLVMLAQRIDISEEIDRLDAHVKEIYQILTKKEPVGRRLDFIMQECNRETNTLAAKSINTSVTASAVELKVLIEQMREQVQNIE